MKGLYLIAAVSQDGGIGKDNELLWRLKNDMKFFRQATIGNIVVMGGKTFRSMGPKPLPQRENLVLTRSAVDAAGVKSFADIDTLKQYLNGVKQPVYIIGGNSLYQAFLSEAEKLYLTEIAATKPADTFFPKFDHALYDRVVIETGTEDGVNYEICEYTRKA